MLSDRPRLLHVITSLSMGGAEVMLRNVTLSPALRDFDMRVVSLTTFDPIGSQLTQAGIPTSNLGARRGVLSVRHWQALRRALVDWQPRIVHSWMYHANVAVGLTLRTVAHTRRARHIAAVRGAVGGAKAQALLTRAVRRIDAALSRGSDRLVFNSAAVREQHRRIGYFVERSVVIPNGFDTVKFRPMSDAREAMRRSLGVAGEPLVGMVARYHPVKGQRIFIEAAAVAAAHDTACKFLLVGSGCDGSNRDLTGLLDRAGLRNRVLLLGERSDVAAVMNALDVGVCASISESFPNAVGEAMSCGVPCIVPDVGDCAHLVGDTGWVVPVADTQALAAAMLAAIESPPAEASARAALARERIVSLFSLDRIAGEYRGLYRDVLGANMRSEAAR